jgi:hypothetical protein
MPWPILVSLFLIIQKNKTEKSITNQILRYLFFTSQYPYKKTIQNKL